MFHIYRPNSRIKARSALVRLLLIGLALTLLFPGFCSVAMAQCDQSCDTLTGISYWDLGLNPIWDYGVRCFGQVPTTTICGGYASSFRTTASDTNTAVGVPSAVQYGGGMRRCTPYYSSGSCDRINLASSWDGRSFSSRRIIDVNQFCIFGGGNPLACALISSVIS